jgi:hypothetical protein
VVFQGDERCAFQHGSRDEMRRMLLRHFPMVIPFFEGAYGDTSSLFYEGHQIDPACTMDGTQQGCSMGTFLYCLSRIRDLLALQERHPRVLFLFIADDAYMAGPPDAVAAAVPEWRTCVQTGHGEDNMEKSALWSPTAAGTAHPGIVALAAEGVPVQPPRSGITCVGHPLGSDDFCVSFYDRKAAKTERIVDEIERLAAHKRRAAIQSAYLLLRYCAEPRIAHLLRCARPQLIHAAAVRHDTAILRGLSALLGAGDHLRLGTMGSVQSAWTDVCRRFGHVAPTPAELDALAANTRTQAQLPLRCGGCGLASAVNTASVAFLGGLAGTARFLARSGVAAPRSEGGFAFPLSGAQFSALCLMKMSRTKVI